jgi:acyl-CoA reductase-like NAD-dependent aldehyde dehydrogenase
MRTINPVTEESSEIVEFDAANLADLCRKVRAASVEWRQRLVKRRLESLSPLPGLLERKLEDLAQIISGEMGKPIGQARREVQVTISETKHTIDHAEEWLRREEVKDGYVEYAPLGVAAVISPWNFPLLLPLRGIVPALVAGNGVIFKPSELTPRTGLAVAELIRELPKLPADLFRCIIGGKDVGRAIVESDVDLIAFTGSTAAGKHIAQTAAGKLKRVLLELGGLDAAIVLRDANVKKAASAIVRNNASNSGQICCSVKRVYVEQPVYDEFVAEAQKVSEGLRLGDPAADPDMGPIVSRTQLERVQAFVEDARKKGARIRTGGKRAGERGYFFPSTVITDVTPEMKLLHEEPFGPVLPILPVEDWHEAVELANSSRYGLAGSVWTTDEELGARVAGELEVGVAGVNFHGGTSPGCPWGGTKESGIGRMKTKEGLREFTNVRLVRLGSRSP